MRSKEIPSHSGAAAKRQKVDEPDEPYKYPAQCLYAKLLNGDIITVFVPFAATTVEELANIVDEKMIKRGDYGGKKRVDKIVYGGKVYLPRGEEKNKLTLMCDFGLQKECTVLAFVK